MPQSNQSNDAPIFLRKNTAGGSSQIVFGNYHEPNTSSYQNMTGSPRNSAGAPRHGLERDQYREREQYRDVNPVTENPRSFRGASDIFNLRPEEAAFPDRHRSSRYRPDKNQSNVFNQTQIPEAQPAGLPRQHRQASDIFHANSQQPTYESFNTYKPEIAPTAAYKQLDHAPYVPSNSFAAKRHPSSSRLFGGSDTDLSVDEQASKGKRHYPQQHHNSNIFHY